MEYETVIGLEVHAQLITRSKMFCRCRADYADAPPNTHVCPVCLGMPGVLPAINRQAVEYTLMTGLALNCTVSPYSKFDRKNYPYPDLMKGYQISQYDAPLCRGGWLTIDLNGQTKRAGITRVHLEEDTAKLVHRPDPSGEACSLVDVNRSGVPLMEVVGEPDLRSPEEARQYLMKLRRILQYIGVSTGNMEEGSFRCDANVSIRPVGTKEYLSKVEVKNMNSFRAVYRALEYEVERQKRVLAEGGRIVQETRGWVEELGATVSQRTKEYAHDYRYFPEPDLPPLAVSPAWVEQIKALLPELPDARKERFMAQYGLSSYDATILVNTKALADLYEASVRSFVETSKYSEGFQEKAKTVSNWLLGEFSRLLNATGLEASQTKVTPEHLAELLALVEDGSLGGTAAKAVFEEMFHTGKKARDIVSEQGLTQISAATELEETVLKVLSQNPQAVSDYKGGKGQALGFLVGQAMKETRGRANPTAVHDILKKKLDG